MPKEMALTKGKPKRTKEEQRRYIMSRIKSNDTKIEVRFRKTLWHQGIRYRKNYKSLPGTPDIVITKYRVVIFCDGEFWHGKDWETKKQKLKSNREFWIAKIERNMNRDRNVDCQLQSMGWVVLHFWGKDIEKNLDGCVKVVEEALFQIKPGSIPS